jgi:hypothetical protein
MGKITVGCCGGVTSAGLERLYDESKEICQNNILHHIILF